MILAFDADVLIYAANPGHGLGRRVASLFRPRLAHPDHVVGVGSVLLLPELLAKPLREGDQDELDAIIWLLAALELQAVDAATAELAATLGARHGLRPIDAVHLATAVRVGADHFLTNNRRDFPASITEVTILYPAELPDPG